MRVHPLFFLLILRASKLPPEQQRVLRNEVLVARGSLKEPPLNIEQDVERVFQQRMQEVPVPPERQAMVRNELREQVKASHEVEMLSEIGVVMLLFTIGIEYSLNNLMQIKKYVLVGGALQVFLTLGATAALSLILGLSAPESIFMGFLK